jgi:hypothetical protein
MADRPETLLITDNKTVLLEMGRDGKFSAKSKAWEDNKVILEGEEMVIRGEGGRWFIITQPAKARLVTRLVDARGAGVTDNLA